MQQQQQQQQHLMQMQPMMAASAAYYPNNVTTDHIQQYLDENKSLILKIVESQNSGKLNDCAENQARLQRNLMYLAAIADSQPQPPPSMHSQFPPGGILQGGGSGHYMQQQQQQQMTPQSLMAARSSMVYSQQQQAMHAQLGMSSVGASGLHMMQNEGNSSGYADFGRAGENMQGLGLGRGMGIGIGMGNKMEIGSGEGRGGENLYLKSGEDGSN